MNIDDFKLKFEIFKKTSINLESSLNDKRKIIEENKGNKALVEIKENPDKYLLGIIEPKNAIFFGLNAIKNKEKYTCSEVIKYEDLSGLIICSD